MEANKAAAMPPSFESIERLPHLNIMVVFPHEWKGGFFRVAALFCNSLAGIEHSGRPVRVFFGVRPGYEIPEPHLLSSAINVVHLQFESVAANDERFVSPRLMQSYGDGAYDIPLITPYAVFPHDGHAVIDEIDGYILLTGLFFEGAFVSRKPYAVYVADFIQRYVPEIYSDVSNEYSVPTWRMDRNQRAVLKGAAAVFGTTPGTLLDALGYGGVPKSNLIQFPMFFVDLGNIERAAEVSNADASLFDVLNQEHFEIDDGPYFLWVTNASAHKNHIMAFAALREYYQNLGGSLRCIICGPVTDMLRPGKSSLPYHQKIYAEIAKWPTFAEHLRILAYVDDPTYIRILSKAHFLWHNVIYDNGTFSILEAAGVGTPILTSDYPQLRFIAETYNIECEYFSPFDPNEAAVKLLEFQRKAKLDVPSDRTTPVNPESEVADYIREVLDRMF